MNGQNAHLILFDELFTLRKKEQLEKAIQYCRENDCKGYQALSTGLFPLVKSPLTINMYLTQKNKSPSEAREYCSVLTVEEESVLVKFLVSKNRAYQPMNRKDCTKYILAMLKLRSDHNKKTKGGRKFKKLSPAATRALKNKSLGRKFWERFDVKYKDVIKKKRRGCTSLKRILACTEEMAKSHIDDLAGELQRCGIMKMQPRYIQVSGLEILMVQECSIMMRPHSLSTTGLMALQTTSTMLEKERDAQVSLMKIENV